MKRVIALDPGKTTGYTIAVLEDPKYVHLSYSEAEWDVQDLWKFLLDTDPDHVIIEDFEFRQGKQRSGLNLFPVQLIGVTRLYCAPTRVTSSTLPVLWIQKAAQGKMYYTDERLKGLDIYKKGVQHGRDACRHFMQWLTFGAGFKWWEVVEEPQLNLVEEDWIKGAYFQLYN